MSYPDIVKTPAYKKAFALYLRTGAPIDLTLKAAAKAEAEHATTHYIWRTRGDNKVRASHAANNGKIFSWDDPPPTGHPGDDYGCRCWAQPYNPSAPEYLDQAITSIVDEGLSRWEWYDFVIHYYFGGGAAVPLANIGHLQDVIDRANEHDLEPHQVFEGVEIQVLKAARAARSGAISDTFTRGYDFSRVSFVHRISKIQGSFSGTAQEENDYLIITAAVNYEFSDDFTDPLDIIQLITGTPKELGDFINKLATARKLSIETLIELYMVSAKRKPEDIYDWIKWISEFGGTKYPVTGSWKTALHAYVHKDAARSKYPANSRNR